MNQIPPSAPSDAPSYAISVPHNLTYSGRLDEIFRIWILNILLTVATLGVYSFWGRTRLRRYAAASFTLGGDRLEYVGTGKELFIGFAKTLPVIVLLYLPYVFFPPPEYPATYLVIPVYIYLLYVGAYAALRYRLSRTIWRGIRAHLAGSAFVYGGLKMALLAANILSLGLAIGATDRIATRYVTERIWAGNVRARFSGEGGNLQRLHMISWLLIIPTFGLSRLWYAVALLRYQANTFRLGGVRLRADMTGAQGAKLIVGNILITLATLGLGRPLTFHRTLAFTGRHLWLEGDLEAQAAQIGQSEAAVTPGGEGLDGFFETGGL